MKEEPCDEGSGSIVTVGVIACVFILGLALLAYVSIQAQGTRVQAVADMAAIAGAECLQDSLLAQGGADPCGCAEEVVVTNGLSAPQCWQDGEDVRVVFRQPWTFMRWTMEIQRQARAGPLE